MAPDWWQKRTAQRDALTATASAEWHHLSALREQILASETNAERWRRMSTGRTRQAVDDLHYAARQAVERAEQAAGQLAAAAPEGHVPTAGAALADISRVVDELDQALRACDEAFASFAALGLRLDRLRTALPARLRELALTYQHAESLLGAQRAGGWSVEPFGPRLAGLRARIFAVDLTRPVNDWLALDEQLAATALDLASFRHELAALAEHPAALREWHTLLTAAVSELAGRRTVAEQQLADRARLHDQRSLYPVSSHLFWIASHLQDASRCIADGAAAAGLGQPDGDDSRRLSPTAQRQAERAFEDANLHLSTGNRMVDEIDRLCRELDDAIIEARGLLIGCRQAQLRLAAAVDAHRLELGEELRAAPAKATDEIERIERMLAGRDLRVDGVVAWCEEVLVRLAEQTAQVDRERVHWTAAHAFAAQHAAEVRWMLRVVYDVVWRPQRWSPTTDDVNEALRLQADLDHRPYDPAGQERAISEVRTAAEDLQKRVAERIPEGRYIPPWSRHPDP